MSEQSGLGRILRALFGSANERSLKAIYPLVARINDWTPKMEALSDATLEGKTAEFRRRLEAGEDLDNMLPEAFASVREAARRTMGMRPFDVQMLGAIVLHNGGIAEMMTGEGKTLVACAPAYLNALVGKGVHIVTVNDYLVRRDRDWMAPVYGALGMQCGAIYSDMDQGQKLRAYRMDITFGTNSELGFDYLRDNMRHRKAEQCLAHFHYAIVDEVDNILIDEARTPLIISGPAAESTEKYRIADGVVRRLQEGPDFEINEKDHHVLLTEEGIEKAERMIGVESFYTPGNMDWPHHIEQALKAHNLYKRDKEYVVQPGEDGREEVIIVDEFTGRLMPGRRWSDGLHQAVEAKERIAVRNEFQTLATVTYQNFFRLYKKLAGITGTARTEAAEFHKIYNLDTVQIPTHRPLIRADEEDRIYRTSKEKYDALVEHVAEVHGRGQPVLVGTTSIEKNELVSGLLKNRGVPHQVLNAKNHAREAEIIARAGQRDSVTIATNMAGRGTDIILGEGIAALGGLRVVGTERHEARRIDNQLRGRAGRQGDPGSSVFFLSLQDDLMRIFAKDWVGPMLQRLGMEEGEEIRSPMVSRMIANVQRKMEGQHFDMRKHVLDYDVVMDHQRKQIYGLRQSVLEGGDTRKVVLEMLDQVVLDMVQVHLEREGGEKDEAGLISLFQRRFGLGIEPAELTNRTMETVAQTLIARCHARFAEREEKFTPPRMRMIERYLLLNAIDEKWKDHLYAMDALRSGIGLRGYGSEDPKTMYRIEGSRYFEAMLASVREEVTEYAFQIELPEEPPPPPPLPEPEGPVAMDAPVSTGGGGFSDLELPPVPPPETDEPENPQAAEPPESGATAPAGTSAFTPLSAPGPASAEDLAGPRAAPAPSNQKPRIEARPVMDLPVSGAYGIASSGELPVGEATRAMAAAADANARSAAPGRGAGRTVKRDDEKVGRNDTCPCGSGRKFKKCHGRT